MAGMGKRLRPHTLVTPKPLVHVANKPIVHRLVSDIASVTPEPITSISFIIGHFGEAVEDELLTIAGSVGAQGYIFYQEEALGTAHAIWCAAQQLSGPTIVAFADTLFFADFRLDTSSDGIIWTKVIDDPSQFGVVVTNDQGEVTQFVEKPKEPVSNEAIIGIYYFKDGDALNHELQYLIDNKVTVKGEYQLTDALENLKAKGKVFTTATVTSWLDCGNKEALLDSNHDILKHDAKVRIIDKDVEVTDSIIIQPCNIAKGVRLERSVVGPYVSIGEGATLRCSIISNSIVGSGAVVEHVVADRSVLGKEVHLAAKPVDLSLGDYSKLKL